jgi:threonine aldolase
MRQAGYLAAAGIYALKNNIERLATDHEHAKQLGEALQKKDFVSDLMPVETNIVIFSVKDRFTSDSLVSRLKEDKIYGYAISPTQVRLVTHFDLSQQMIQKTIDVIQAL